MTNLDKVRSTFDAIEQAIDSLDAGVSGSERGGELEAAYDELYCARGVALARLNEEERKAAA